MATLVPPGPEEIGGPGGLNTPGGERVTGGRIPGGPVGASGRDVVSCPLLPRPRAIMIRSTWSGAPA